MNKIVFHLSHPFTLPPAQFLTTRDQLISVVFSAGVGALVSLSGKKLLGRVAMGLSAGISLFYLLSALLKKTYRQQEPVGPVGPVEPCSPIVVSTPYKAKVALLHRSGGLVGEDPDYVPEDLTLWTLENDTPLTKDPKELLLTFYLFNRSEKLNGISYPTQPILPASLFTNKKEGDVMRLKYRGSLIELTLDQNSLIAHRFPEGDCRFEHILATNVEQLSEDLRTGNNGHLSETFNGPYFQWAGYTLDRNGTLYQAHPTELHEVSSDLFRPCLYPDKGSFELFTSPFPLICMTVSGIGDRVDIVINDKFLCIYACKKWAVENRWRVVRSTRPTSAPFEHEYLSIIPWKQFFCCSLEEMKSAITNGESTLKDGIFTLKLNPLPQNIF